MAKGRPGLETVEGPQSVVSRESELKSLDARIADATGALGLSKAQLRNKAFLYVISVGVLGGLVVALYPYLKATDRLFGSNTIVVVYAVLAYAMIGLVYVLFHALSHRASVEAELEVLEAKRHILARFAQTSLATAIDGGYSYFDSLVEINVENLGAYYRLVKVQTDKSFSVAVATGVFGFALLVVGLAAGFFERGETQTMTYISSAAGVLTEFISGVFFYLYNRTVRQLKDYHDSLLAVQNILLSFKLVSDVKPDADRVKMVGQMLSYLVGTRQPQGGVPSGSSG